MPAHLKTERRKKIIELRNAGLTLKEIAYHIGESRSKTAAAIESLLKLGLIPKIHPAESRKRYLDSLKLRKYPKFPFNKDHITALYYKYKKQEDVAQELNVAPTTITAIRKINEDLIIAECANNNKYAILRFLIALRKKDKLKFKEKLIELYNRGLTYGSLAVVMNAPYNQLRDMLHKLFLKGKLKRRGVSGRPKKVNTKDFEIFW